MVKSLAAVELATKVCDAVINPLSDVIPPVEPASVPHTNCPLFQVSFPVDPSQVAARPAPKKLEVDAVVAKKFVAVAFVVDAFTAAK